MLRLTLTTVVALYASFVIWGDPKESAVSPDAQASAVVSEEVSDFDTPVIVAEDGVTKIGSDTQTARASTEQDQLPAASLINASASNDSGPRLIGEPIVVSLVRPDAPAPAATPVAETTEGLLRVTGSRVNMRAGPSTSNRVVDSLTGGTLAEPLGEPVDGWLEIRDVATGQTGYMAARFLEPA